MRTHRVFRNLIVIAFPALMTLLLVACGDSRPSDLLSQDEMVPVLKDLHIAYAGVDITTPSIPDRDPKYAELNQVIFSKYNLSEQKFFDSYAYYQRNPRLMDTIYNDVINALNLELAPIQGDKPKPATPAVQDSTNQR